MGIEKEKVYYIEANSPPAQDGNVTYSAALVPPETAKRLMRLDAKISELNERNAANDRSLKHGLFSYRTRPNINAIVEMTDVSQETKRKLTKLEREIAALDNRISALEAPGTPPRFWEEAQKRIARLNAQLNKLTKEFRSTLEEAIQGARGAHEKRDRQIAAAEKEKAELLKGKKRSSLVGPPNVGPVLTRKDAEALQPAPISKQHAPFGAQPLPASQVEPKGQDARKRQAT